jgi:hypothetical protein
VFRERSNSLRVLCQRHPHVAWGGGPCACPLGGGDASVSRPKADTRGLGQFRARFACTTSPHVAPPPVPPSSLRIGSTLCAQVVVASSSQLLCNAPAAPVGAYPLTVSLNGQNSTGRVRVHRLCGEGQFGLPGQECGDCPEVCSGLCCPCCRLYSRHRTPTAADALGDGPSPTPVHSCPLFFIVGRAERGVRGAVPSAAAQAGFLQHIPHVLQQLCAGSRVSWRGRSASVRDIQWPAAGRAC